MGKLICRPHLDAHMREMRSPLLTVKNTDERMIPGTMSLTKDEGFLRWTMAETFDGISTRPRIY